MLINYYTLVNLLVLFITTPLLQKLNINPTNYENNLAYFYRYPNLVLRCINY